MNIKKIICPMFVISCIGIAGAANAGTITDFYAGATMGAGAATVFAGGNNSTDTAMSYGVMAGLDIPLIRVEAEYNYLHDADANMNIGMVNAYFKMPSTVIMPYLGIGLGSMFSGSSGDVNLDATAAYQGMLGLTFDLPALPIKIDVEGRALYIPNVFAAGNVRPDILHYDARIKLRYVF